MLFLGEALFTEGLDRLHNIITVDNKSVESFFLKKTHFDKARWMAAVYSPTLWLAKPVLKRDTTHSTLAFA